METSWYLFHGIVVMVLVIAVGVQAIYLVRLNDTVTNKLFSSERVDELAQSIKELRKFLVDTVSARPIAPIVITDSSTIDLISNNMQKLADNYEALANKQLTVTQRVEMPDGTNLTEELDKTRVAVNTMTSFVMPLSERFDEYEKMLRQIGGR